MDYDIFKEFGIILPSLETVDDDENPKAIAKFSNGNWTWFILAGKQLDNKDYYLFGLVNGIEKELGFFTLNQIIEAGAVYDPNFKPIGVFDIYPDFDLRR